MRNPKKKVLIVGAGLAGLAMYLALDKTKFDVEIIEKNPEFKRLGYALIFMPLGVGVLRRLGFKKTEVASIGRNFLYNKTRDKNNNVILVSDFRGLIKKFDKYMMVTRERLYKLLEKKIPKGKIFFGITPKSLVQNKTGKVNVKFRGNKHDQDYDAVIGADGIYSGVRKIIYPNSKLNSTGLSLIWSWIPRKKGVYPLEMGSIGGEKEGVGFFNSGEKKESCMAFFIESKNVPRNIGPRDYKNLLKRVLQGFKGPVPKILQNLPPGEEMYFHGDYELDIESWYKGNTVLIGDAAHARSVLSGTGSSLALEDAVVLGHFLNHENNAETAIKKYFTQQHSRIKDWSMSKIKLYLQDQRGITGFLEKFFASSLIYSNKDST